MNERDDFLDLEKLKHELSNFKIDLTGVMNESRKEINYGQIEPFPQTASHSTSNLIYSDTRTQAPIAAPTSYHDLVGHFNYDHHSPPFQVFPMNPQALGTSPYALNPVFPPPPAQHNAHPVIIHQASNLYKSSHQPSPHYHLNNPEIGPSIVERPYYKTVVESAPNKVPIKSVDDFYSTASRLQQMDEQGLCKLLLPQDVCSLFLNKSDLVRSVKERIVACKQKVTSIHQIQDDIDGFLREFIAIMDQVREDLFSQVDAYYANFDPCYSEFSEVISEFLKKSVNLMNQ